MIRMAIKSGKKKRRSQLDDEAAEGGQLSDDIKDADLQALFRKHFETHFKPLPDTHRALVLPVGDTEEGNEGESMSDWEGLSDENEPVTELIQYTAPWTAKPELTREESKIFMVCLRSIAFSLNHY